MFDLCKGRWICASAKQHSTRSTWVWACWLLVFEWPKEVDDVLYFSFNWQKDLSFCNLLYIVGVRFHLQIQNQSPLGSRRSFSSMFQICLSKSKWLYLEGKKRKIGVQAGMALERIFAAHTLHFSRPWNMLASKNKFCQTTRCCVSRHCTDPVKLQSPWRWGRIYQTFDGLI